MTHQQLVEPIVFQIQNELTTRKLVILAVGAVLIIAVAIETVVGLIDHLL